MVLSVSKTFIRLKVIVIVIAQHPLKKNTFFSFISGLNIREEITRKRNESSEALEYSS